MKLGTGYLFHEAVVLGRRYTADEAFERGIIQRTCPAEDLMSTAFEIVKSVTPKGGFNKTDLSNMKKDIYGKGPDFASSKV